MTDPSSIIPAQHEGNQLDTAASTTLSSREEALKLFHVARKRLLSVNNWNTYAGVLSADFKLTDHLGKETDRLASSQDYFKINIPGPGSVTGEGYDWVNVESVKDISDVNSDTEITSMTVRPAPNPLHHDTNIAHFFDHEATSTFMIKREGLTVTASIHGRNEVPNTSVEIAADRVRNSAVALGAVLGFSKMQWNALAKGLLDDSHG